MTETPLNKIVLLNVGDIKKYARNMKKHPQSQIEKLKKSIKEFGFNVPVLVDRQNIIIAGHGRFIAAQELGMTQIPAIKIEYLTDQQVRAFRIADNKVSESSWDAKMLGEEFNFLKSEGFDLNLTGFDTLEISNLDKPEGSKDDFKTNIFKKIIKYEIIFNDEDEQKKWHDYLVFLKNKYPDLKTISERIVADVVERGD